MNQGKSTCEALKAIRKQIAEANDIQYTPSKCSFEGECRGTCPNCERERQYIEVQLARKHEMGKALKIIGVAAGMATMVACQEAKAQDPSEMDKPVQQKFEWEYRYLMMTGAAPTPYVIAQFEEMAEFVSLFPNDSFLVVGHSGGVGPIPIDDPDRKYLKEKYFRKLTDVRARALRNSLMYYGADTSRIRSIGAGVTEMIIPNAQNWEEYEVNERVTLEFYSKEREDEIRRKVEERKKEKE